MHNVVLNHNVAVTRGVYGFEAIQQFEHESGLVEGIGYLNGQLVRYTAGSPSSSPFECEPITVSEALHWWATLETDQGTDSVSWSDEPRARFLEAAAQSLKR
ncbi:MAG: hypothetical protein MUF81_05205 [Verrucomicrobia bacterium]|jgi:hypothetical protein|nr:hypothetical protein [Verrucomicrobiota bacterium]